MKNLIRNLWSDFRLDLVEYLKIAAIVLGLIALFIIAASAASPVLAAFDRSTGYLP